MAERVTIRFSTRTDDGRYIVSYGAIIAGLPDLLAVVMSRFILMFSRGRCAKYPRHRQAGVPPGACPGARAGPGARQVPALCRIDRGP